jgi:hypothetical protein
VQQREASWESIFGHFSRRIQVKASGPPPLLQKHVAVLAAFAVFLAADPEIERIIVLQ